MTRHLYRDFDPSQLEVPEVHRLLLAGVAPRPIALVSTTSSDGAVNLSPFSFFNTFGANPPVVVFSPAHRGKDGTAKHTFLNLKEGSEFTISVVTFAMVEQISLASCDYDRGVDEFIKSGLTKLPSLKVRPPGVAESPFIMEGRLLQTVEFGGKPGSGNLMIGEVIHFRVADEVYSGDAIDPNKMDAVARLNADWYCRASGDALFRVRKPTHNGIGFDALPEAIRTHPKLTGNELAKLAGVAALPDLRQSRERLLESMKAPSSESRAFVTSDGTIDQDAVIVATKEALATNDVTRAWEVVALITN